MILLSSIIPLGVTVPPETPSPIYMTERRLSHLSPLFASCGTHCRTRVKISYLCLLMWDSFGTSPPEVSAFLRRSLNLMRTFLAAHSGLSNKCLAETPRHLCPHLLHLHLGSLLHRPPIPFCLLLQGFPPKRTLPTCLCGESGRVVETPTHGRECFLPALCPCSNHRYNHSCQHFFQLRDWSPD